MKTSIGGTWLIGLMLVFISLFSAFIILMINYSKTIKIKDDALNIVDNYDGINAQSIRILNNYLIYSNYQAKGVCNNSTDRVYGVASLDSTTVEEAVSNKKYYYCIKKYNGLNMTNYYQLAFFYKFNLPVIGTASGFVVRGTTSNFMAHDESGIHAVN